LAAHIKGGILEGVRAIAGYVQAESGRRYVVVVLVNHPQAAAATEEFQDAVLEWVGKSAEWAPTFAVSKARRRGS